MARRQILVQLDDELIDALGEIAREEGLSRSELIRRAVRAWLEARREICWDREHAEGYRRFPEDAALAESLARIAAENAPPYDA
jgi:metal-responsive CopG/Arc/MetJ family transcriptional regulator